MCLWNVRQSLRLWKRMEYDGLKIAGLKKRSHTFVVVCVALTVRYLCIISSEYCVVIHSVGHA